MTLINTQVQDFKAQAFQNGEFKEITQEDLAGKWNIFFFYPADFTFVCPTELEDLQDSYAELQELGVEVYSISTDTHFTHMAWHGSSPAISKVTYPMLADPTGQISKDFGVYIEEAGLAYRGTFVINPEGAIKIAEVNDNGIGRNAAELVRKVKAAKYVAENDGEVCPARWDQGKETLKPGPDLVGKI